MILASAALPRKLLVLAMDRQDIEPSRDGIVFEDRDFRSHFRISSNSRVATSLEGNLSQGFRYIQPESVQHNDVYRGTAAKKRKETWQKWFSLIYC